MVFYSSLLNAVLAPCVYAASLSVVFPVEGISVAVFLSVIRCPSYRMYVVCPSASVMEVMFPSCHIRMPRAFPYLYRFEGYSCYESPLVRFNPYTSSGSVRDSFRFPVAESQLRSHAVRVSQPCHPEGVSVSAAQIEHGCQHRVMAVCLIPCFRMSQCRTFLSQIHFFP